MKAEGGTFAAPDAYALPVGEQWLLFSPWTWTVALVNRAAADALARRSAEKDCSLSEDMQPVFDALKGARKGDIPATRGTAKLVVLPTRTCNMRCVYCDFEAEHAPASVLDPRLACRLIDHFAERLQSADDDTLRIHFFGGEPLMARECTETIVHYARAVCARRGLVPWFELTTNGFCDPGVLPFVGDYMDSVVVSLDGPAALHDQLRRQRDGRGTFEQVSANVRRLAGYPVELCLRSCISSRSVGAMREIAEFFCAEFDFDVLSFEMLAENECARAAGVRSPDPYLFAAGVVEAEALGSHYGVRMVHGPSELVGPRASSCPLGQGTLMLSPDGLLTACYLNPQQWRERGLDLEIGLVHAEKGVWVDQAKMEYVASLLRAKPRCERCFCRFTCAGGCHVNQTPPDCSLVYDDRCKAIRVLTACRLLRAAGCGGHADRLVRQLPDMEALATHPNDWITQLRDAS